MKYSISRAAAGRRTTEKIMDENKTYGYWCVVCGRFLPAILEGEDSIIVHDDVPHLDDMTFDEESNPQ